MEDYQYDLQAGIIKHTTKFNIKKVIKITHWYKHNVYQLTRVTYNTKKFRDFQIKKNVKVEDVIKYNNKYPNADVEYNYNNSDEFASSFKVCKTLDFLNDDFIEPISKRSVRKPKQVIEVEWQRPINVDDSVISLQKDETYNENYGTCYVRNNRVKQFIHFQQKKTNIKLLFNTKFTTPIIFKEGVADNGFVNIYTKIGSGKCLEALKLHNNKDKKTLAKVMNYMNNEVIYLIAVNIMSGVIEHKDITADIVLQCYLTILMFAMNNSEYKQFELEFNDLRFQAEKFVKKFYNGNRTELLRDKGILSQAYKLYGQTYTGVRYPEGFNKSDKDGFKKENGIVRKKQCNSLEDKIRECYNKGLKQKDVVKDMGYGKEVVKKWYRKFKSEKND